MQYETEASNAPNDIQNVEYGINIFESKDFNLYLTLNGSPETISKISLS